DASARLGIAPQRIELLPRVPYDKYFSIYDRIDIGLDPFPYNGGTTTLDLLWVGVPVITLAGDLPVGRAGVTLMSNLGMPELIAQSRDEYVQIAARLAGDAAGLAKRRASLRNRMKASPILDCARFTRDFESTLRKVWSEYVRER